MELTFIQRRVKKFNENHIAKRILIMCFWALMIYLLAWTILLLTIRSDDINWRTLVYNNVYNWFMNKDNSYFMRV